MSTFYFLLHCRFYILFKQFRSLVSVGLCIAVSVTCLPHSIIIQLIIRVCASVCPCVECIFFFCLYLFVFLLCVCITLYECLPACLNLFLFLSVCLSLYLSLPLCLFIVSIYVSLCRLSVQTLSYEPILGPEAVLESSEAWREHGHSAPQQAPCKWSDDMFTSQQSLHAGILHTDLSSAQRRENKRTVAKDIVFHNLWLDKI